MRFKARIYVLLISVLIMSVLFAQEEFRIPESSYWYPNDLLDWSLEADPDAKYNVSQVPLQKRISGEKISSSASEKVKIVALSIMNSSTSGMPSQGRNDSMKVYPFTYWQYVDYLVAWAGSAGEGIIVPPGPDTIDAGHKNGVPVLGTIFFPPNVYGGRRNWVDQVLQEDEDGTFPVADKLIEVARYYGFDGWFINQETEGCNEEHANTMVRFIKYFKTKAPELIIFWYDAMTDTGEVAWQGELNETNVDFIVSNGERISDFMFVDFRWISSKRPNSIVNTLANSQKYNLSQYDFFAGVLLQGDGYNTPYFNLPKIQNTDGTLKLSLGLYGPCWSYYSSRTFDEFWKKENVLWIGNHESLVYGEKSVKPDWSGFAKFVVEKSPVTKLPFVTNFNVGHGKYFFVNGEKVKSTEWHNRSLQDVMPTYRWKVEGKPLNVQIDYDNAYYGGSSLKFSGEMERNDTALYHLYVANLPVTNKTYFSVAFLSEVGKVDGRIVLKFVDGETLSIPVPSMPQWRRYEYSLQNYAGKTISGIYLSVKSSAKQTVSFNLGEIGVYEKAASPKANKVQIEDLTFSEGIYAQLKLTIQTSEKAKAYEIYRRLPTGNELVWVSVNPYTYIYSLRRFGHENETVLQVVPVSENNTRGKAVSVSFKWPEYPKPKADFVVSNTIIKPGESVVFESKSSETTEKLTWEFEGGEPAVSHENVVRVTYNKEGIYTVKLIAGNISGEDVKEVQGMIVVTKNAEKIQNLALGKDTYASSFVPAEKPALAVDGTVENNSKWCAVGDLPHWLVIDLGKEYIVNRVIIKHAESGKESADWNTKDYRIQISTDGENWKDVVVVRNNLKGITEHSFPPVKGRYVRLFVEAPTQTGDKAARIYEVEVYGLEEQ
ncbi:discoidin domain-containing protein [Fervidobacterium riparium]|uniref:Endo-beta-N-acetylglucosaminidase D n=1 Tax=Fervidobacterium gondwanense DSM 13020 TaxID=1121883 RepID=A0A1M7T3B2_FERGO|nr:discoidin domain-containing protein [Fervidobacterium gondwanense]PHJ12813.1 glycoside hydrolase [Fervidobacterium sp. SC_NGM5_G05]UXF01718.1 glycoside hydrolase [Fervidobacterium riparium]SHN65260.1 Endo-beta-N-acetylglucosaminidase D [Fervidobacterium gondwanense DSM 13020]